MNNTTQTHPPINDVIGRMYEEEKFLASLAATIAPSLVSTHNTDEAIAERAISIAETIIRKASK